MATVFMSMLYVEDQGFCFTCFLKKDCKERMFE